jgi:hypothetical protein
VPEVDVPRAPDCGQPEPDPGGAHQPVDHCHVVDDTAGRDAIRCLKRYIAREIYHLIHDHIPRAGFAPAPLLEHLVTAGYLSRKIGRGLRDYS